jgi:phthiocerol/phenolphthiocerol synthesis type-I polyketide synthase E
MAAHYARELVESRGKDPVHLLGWSFGGLVAFEMRHHLAAAGVEVVSTTMLDTLAPSPRLDAPDVDAALETLYDLAWSYGLDISMDELATKSIEERVAWVAERTRGTEREIDAATLADYVRIGTAHRRAMDSYVPTPTDARIVRVNAADREGRAPQDEEWKRYATQLEVRTSPGTHGVMLKRPNVEVLHALLEEIWRR